MSGAKTDTYAYEAFGSTVSTTGTSVNPYRFAGERFVGDVGMYQNRARWLDTRTGRFVSADPSEGDDPSPVTFQPYLYGKASPVTYVDATGWDFTIAGAMMSLDAGSILDASIANPVPSASGKGPQSANEVAETRNRISNYAQGFAARGSLYWAKDARKDNFPEGSYKCAKFVYDVLVLAGADPGRPRRGPLSFLFGGEPYPPTAADWADSTVPIPGWRPVLPGEFRQRCDVVAQAAAYSDASGHAGIVGPGGTYIGTSDLVDPEGIIVEKRMPSFLIYPPQAANSQLVYRRWEGQ